MIIYKRQAQQVLKDLTRFFKVITITGPRQSGKTTLIRNIFPDYKYFNLEDINTSILATKDPLAIVNKENLPFIIDEVQNVPNLLSQIQVLADNLDKPGQIVLTGSSNLILMEKITQSLAGRTAILTLLPFNLYELASNRLLNFKKESLSYNILDLIITGFYPQLYKDKNLPASLFYSNYISTYVEKDIRNTIKINNYSEFVNLINLLVGRIGQLVDVNDLSNSLSVSRTTVNNWINLLQVSYILFKLYPFYNNFGKRFIKRPKIYFTDTGLASYLLNIKNAKQLTQHFAKGGLIENFIILDYIKTAFNLNLKPNAYYIRTASGIEIDLFIEQSSKMHAIEIKSNYTIKEELFKNLSYVKKLDKNISTYLIYLGDKTLTFKGHRIIPISEISKLWLEILGAN